MLVLSRKLGEVIVVPQCKLTITILAVNGRKVRIGIAAPDDIDVFREELWQTDHDLTGRSPAPEKKADGDHE